MAEVTFGEDEIFHILYEISKGGTNHDYSTRVNMHGDNLSGEGARVSVDLNVDPDDYPDHITEETVEEAELMIAACLDENMSLLNAKMRHGSDDSGLLP